MVYTVINDCKDCGGELIRSRKLRAEDKIRDGYLIPGSHKEKVLGSMKPKVSDEVPET